MYASDYPHWDSEFPHNIDELRDHPRLSEAEKQAIFYDNARTFYRLEVGAVVR
jgi:predicted TIM-barrel fold metal-dependent hydrolase